MCGPSTSVGTVRPCGCHGGARLVQRGDPPRAAAQRVDHMEQDVVIGRVGVVAVGVPVGGAQVEFDVAALRAARRRG